MFLIDLKPNIKETKIVKLANKGESAKEVKIGALILEELKNKIKITITQVLRHLSKSYHDMPDLDTDIIVHKISV